MDAGAPDARIAGHRTPQKDRGETARTITLPDGRRLAFAEYGDPRGQPVLYFHGFPGSRLGARLGHEAGRRVGARLIGIDRPGWGLSGFKRGRNILDWPEDVVRIADRLGIGRFAVVGMSAGAPYVAACAYKLGDRLTTATIVSGIAPLGAVPGGIPRDPFPARLTGAVYRLWPRFAWWSWLWLSRLARPNPEWFLARLSTLLPASDAAVFSRPDVRATLIDDFHEAFRAGYEGPRYEATLNHRPWGFPLEHIRVPFRIWQGEQDTAVPPSSARHLASAIPHCKATFVPREGHVSLIVRHVDRILEELVR